MDGGVWWAMVHGSQRLLLSTVTQRISHFLLLTPSTVTVIHTRTHARVHTHTHRHTHTHKRDLSSILKAGNSRPSQEAGHWKGSLCFFGVRGLLLWMLEIPSLATGQNISFNWVYVTPLQGMEPYLTSSRNNKKWPRSAVWKVVEFLLQRRDFWAHIACF